MNIVKFAIEKPVTVTVGVILLLLFGLIALMRMPYQLTPSVEEPEITVTTVWLGATPYEIERDIVEKQENALKGVSGLIEMESNSINSRGTVTLRFRTGTDVDDALLRVSNKLDEVPSYPENVEKPVINATGATASPVIWTVLKTRDGNSNHVAGYLTFFENEVRQYLERVEGVADLFVAGGTEQELHVIVSPERLAAYGLTVTDVLDALRSANVNVAAGTLGLGRRDYRIRTVAEFSSPEQVEQVVLRSTGQRRVYLSDVAHVTPGHQKRTVAMLHNSREGIAVGVRPEPGANILDLTDRVEEQVRWLNGGLLERQGVYLDWVYDERPYIRGAINLIKQNIAIGGVLAVLVLLLFLRSITATFIVATTVPISIIGTFIFMKALGRNLNVVSLAGISFAVGMLLDSAIVVLENIDRHRMMGKGPFQAAYDGAREVWGAILASAATTVAVFLPVVFVEQEAGQLFRDIAIAVTAAVSLSLFVSVLVIPMLSNQLYKRTSRRRLEGEGRIGRASGTVGRTGGRFAEGIMRLLGIVLRNAWTRAATVLGLVAFSILTSWLLFPKMEYLPQGNRNFILNILIPPPGLSYEEKMEIGEQIFRATGPHFGEQEGGRTGIRHMFYVGSDFINLFGARATHEQRAGELIPIFTPVIQGIPGVFGVSIQAGIFQTRLGRGRTINLDISGNDLGRVVQVAGTAFGMVRQEMPEAQVRPVPSLEFLYPEVRLHPDRDRIRAVGMTERDFGFAVDVLMGGRKAGEFNREGEKGIDLVLKAPDEVVTTPEALYGAPVATPGGKIVPVSSLAELERTTGLTEIRHLERRRTVTLEVTPPPAVPLESAMETLRDKVIGALEKQGMLTDTFARLSGAADKLTVARRALQWNFVLAAVIAYLLMAALFENFLYPLIIMVTVPLAAAGGFLGLGVVNIFTTQPLDILTMLGFIILIGIVVNNAILIVHQALNNIRNYGMEYREAVLASTRSRLRPIYMTAATSIFGMLPLVVAPGPGSELYRGLGSVILGGIALSTVFTVFIIPSLLLFFVRMEKVDPARKEAPVPHTADGRVG
jgi:hydrophobic/amphiphilic exporter-1 (mainly G- bacteria), HAE1 family